MSYTIEIADAAYNELQAVKTYNRRQIVDAIDQQLIHEPATETKNRKILIGIQPDFEHGEPVWELRVGQYRVYYDISEDSMIVRIRAVREKPPHMTTEQIT